MTRIARIEAGVVVELLTLPPAHQDFSLAQLFPDTLTWADASATPAAAPGWHYDGHALTPPPPTPEAAP